MSVDIFPFDPDKASDAELRGQYELAIAAFSVDRPDAPKPGYDTFVGRLRAIPPGVGRQRFWAARRQGHLAGLAITQLSRSEDDNSIVVDVRVHPELRRQGIGTALLRRALGGSSAEGRELIVGRGVTAGGDGEQWIRARGFTVVQRVALQVLRVPEVDPALWEVPVPAGHRLEQWTGAAPDTLVESFARARGAIHDAPVGDSSYRHPHWSVPRVRQAEHDARRRGVEHRAVVVVHEASDAVVGLTELEIFPGMPDTAVQQDTAVLPRHRGRGLGRTVKAAMMRWLLAERPEIRLVVTNVDAGNDYMTRVNHQLGYVTTRIMLTAEAALGALESRLSALAWERGMP
ncbi:GNAT family N-acetyltransferase [Nonomuraea sp. 3-1Str]|uniref:GNAT family N-acetyltransferase n=1 Tax=Nonomuraea sp. 3-1Str TaxID=2929801 RepID=UPI00285C325A|nr:GNAT family N-acetyltransferase [Nonomuraea sp. 3-1Str]MDR8411765.1 GNAT family N-acetyltransferase [Nonomuraea sp. 3-1Str]